MQQFSPVGSPLKSLMGTRPLKSDCSIRIDFLAITPLVFNQFWIVLPIAWVLLFPYQMCPAPILLGTMSMVHLNAAFFDFASGQLWDGIGKADIPDQHIGLVLDGGVAFC